MFRSIINKFQPILCFGGHFHENQGKANMKKTIIVNAGPTGKGKAAIIDIEKGKVKNIKFLR